MNLKRREWLLRRSVVLECSPFAFKVESSFPEVFSNLETIYGNRIVDGNDYDGFIDYFVSIKDSGGLRRFLKDQARFTCDSLEPFKPLNRSQSYALLEWGLNWVIAAHEVSHLIIHSAVLAKNGKAVLFPAPPGSGKSTLTAYLSRNGWRLLSDEMALITPLTLEVTPFVRPICLKNDSIDLVKSWYPKATFSTIAKDTHKGDVVHMAPDEDSVKLQNETAQIAGVVFPKFTKNKFCDIFSMDKATAYT
ncbi:MAG TPA: HprK-related kinase A, partial [Pseudoalteromonas sp.]|nr:HprK-related kinase A [Pseudoalteromonas sp.]